ncbi:MAG TPA: indole-3-glycerol phosphate synthase TrpC [Candidatus Sulfotelmatobacter sp.]|nr:indole-3-glycerol phosphate synthase TrpC [Candidatus Sulfotelmatobacter sp.]
MSDRLGPIIERRRADVVAARRARPLAALRDALAGAPPVRGFRRALAAPGLQIVAEIKRRSPSAGAIREDAQPAEVARRYQAAGAAALSILTEPHHFGGTLDDLIEGRAAVSLPVLRKDFTVDPYQLAEARVAGADAVLLIVAAVPDHLAELGAEARALGLDVLVEVHDERELALALDAGADLIGINNRNLHDFSIDLATTERLRPRIPPGILVIGESGIETPADMRRMVAARVDAVLIGSSLMRSPDPGARLATLKAAGESS